MLQAVQTKDTNLDFVQRVFLVCTVKTVKKSAANSVCMPVAKTPQGNACKVVKVDTVGISVMKLVRADHME